MTAKTKVINRKLVSTTIVEILMKNNYFVCAQNHNVFVTYPDKKEPMTTDDILALLPSWVTANVVVYPPHKGISEILINLN